MKRWIVCACSMFASGCVTTGLLTDARNLDAGSTEITFAPEVALAGSTSAGSPVGHLTGAVRHGVSEHVQLGLRLWGLLTPSVSLIGAGVESKYQLLRSDSTEHGLDIAIAPGAGYQPTTQRGTDTHVIALAVPLVFGFNIPGGHQFIVAPTFQHQSSISSGAATVHFPFVGSTTGLALEIVEDFVLQPELSLFWSPVTTERSNGTWILRGTVGARYDLTAYM